MFTKKSLVRDFRKETSKEKKMRDCGLTRLKKRLVSPKVLEVRA